MTHVTHTEKGLFPQPGEISLDCSCPDWADMCKHVAAVLYGVGARLDKKPELLFLLRGVEHTELVGEEAARTVVSKAAGSNRRTLDDGSLSEVFGIEMAAPAPAPVAAVTAPAALAALAAKRKKKAVKGAEASPPKKPSLRQTRSSRPARPASKPKTISRPAPKKAKKKHGRPRSHPAM